MKLKTIASALLAAAILAVPAADAWAKKPKHHATTSHAKHSGVKASQHAGAAKSGKKHSAKTGKHKSAKAKKHV